MSVFLSYSRRDDAYVTRLADHLRRAGLPVWLDTERIDYGDRWEHVVRDQVDRCSAVVVVMSPAAEASPHVGNELQRARELGKPILPVLLSGNGFFALGTSHRFDARGGRLPDERFLAVLRRHAPGRPAGQLVVGDPPRRAASWQDRPGPLDEVVRATEVCVLAGPRGVGKTQLAAAYARLRIQHGWPVVVWAVAETEAGLVSALDELAAAAGVREERMDPPAAAHAALRWLRAHPGPCLLVFDNAEDADLIRDWIPPLGPVHTVVTTTHRQLDSLGTLVDVSLFTAEEAVEYLVRRTGDEDAGAAREVAESLGRLPLAVAQAGAAIGEGRRYPGYRAYLRALAEVPTAELLPRTPGDPYPLGAADGILLSLDGLDGPARRLLNRLAVLSPAGVDRALLSRLAPEGSADRLVAVLAGRSLVTATERVVTHRLIQRVVRERLREAGTIAEVVETAAATIEAKGNEAELEWRDRALVVEYAEHTRALLEALPQGPTGPATLRLVIEVVRWLNRVHHFAMAITFVPRLLVDVARVLRPDDPDASRAHSIAARTYVAVGRHQEAIDLQARAAADYERVYDSHHPSTLFARDNLAGMYRDAGRLDEAVALLTGNVADREHVFGDDHPETLASRHNLAVAYVSTGRLTEAVELYRRNLADRERVLGTDHPDSFIARQGLGDALTRARRLDEAIDLLTRALAGQERVLGTDHPKTVRCREDLARAYRAAGRHDDAEALLER